MTISSTAIASVIQAVIEPLRLNMSVSLVQELIVAVEQGNFIDFINLLDQAFVADSASRGVGRNVTDVFAAIDLLAKHFSRGVADSALIQELVSNGLHKGAVETAAVNDTAVVFPTKGILDIASATDSDYNFTIVKALFTALSVTDDLDGEASLLDDQEMQFVKVRAETAYVADTLFRAVTFRRYFSDVTSFSDATEVGTSKTFAEATGAVDAFSFIAAYARELADSSVVSDAITRRAVDKVLSDTSAAADQFDRVVAFVRSAYENTSAADNFSVLVQRPAGDDLSVSDVVEILLTVNLLFSDTPTVSDDYSNDFAKHVADAINLQEATALAATKTAADATGLSDTASSGVGKSATEAVSSSDSQTSVFTKGVEDTPAFADTRFAVYQKALTDTATASDDVDGEATLLDDQEIQFLKQRTDAATISDVILVLLIFARNLADNATLLDDQEIQFAKQRSDAATITDVFATLRSFVRNPVDTTAASESASKAFARSRADSALLGDAVVASPGKGVLETTSTSDEGSLRSQGYADFIYFAEDYVGASQTF